MNTLIARNTARGTRGVARLRFNPVRKYAGNPTPPPSGPSPLEAEGKGSGVPIILGGLVAGAGVGWYYYTRKEAEESKDVKLKARDLDHAARVQTQQKIDEGRDKFDQAKADSRAKIGSTQSSVHSTYSDASNKANATAADAQARLASSLQQTKEATEKAAHDTKVYVEDKAEQAQSSWWSWLGWGKSKSRDAKEVASAEAAKAAKEVKEKAGEAEQSAQKRA